MGFTERLVAPSKTDTYYYSNNNPYYKNGYGMPNCTAYACGRVAEINGQFVTGLAYGNAEDWYPNTTILQKGNAPKFGAIICWRKGSAGNSSDGAGHVAVVERINSDGSILTSNSAYQGTNFYTQTLKPPYNLGSTYVLQGFIYATASVPTDIVGTPVSRNTAVNQVEVLINDLYARIRPESNNEVIAGYIKKGIYNVISTRDMTNEASNGYYWYQVGSNLWIAKGSTWNTYYAAQSVTPSDDKDKEITALKASLNLATIALTSIKNTADAVLQKLV